MDTPPPPPSRSRLSLWLTGQPGKAGFLPKLAISLPFTAGLIGTYSLVGYVVRPGGADLSTALDHAIPFVPWTVWFYIPGYSLCFLLPVLLVEDWEYFFRMAAALVLASLPAWTTHALFPVAYPRPEVPAGASIDLSMLRWVYGFDPPHNTFPSLHVALAMVMTASAWGLGRRVGWAVTALTVGMTISTLTLKQHFIADILGGWVAAAVAWALVLRGHRRW